MRLLDYRISRPLAMGYSLLVQYVTMQPGVKNVTQFKAG